MSLHVDAPRSARSSATSTSAGTSCLYLNALVFIASYVMWHRIKSEVARRRAEQEERLAARNAEGEHRTSAYGRYLALQERRAQRIHAKEAEAEAEAARDQTEPAEADADAPHTAKADARRAARDAHRSRQRARHPLLEFDFDETGPPRSALSIPSK